MPRPLHGPAARRTASGGSGKARALGCRFTLALVSRCMVLPYALLVLVTTFAAARGAGADDFIPVDEWRGEDGLTGDDIYEQVLANRFDASRSLLSLSSMDRGERRQLDQACASRRIAGGGLR